MRTVSILPATALALLVLVAAAEAYVWTHRGDAPQLDAAEFASRWRTVPDDENGLVRLRSLAAHMVWSDPTYGRLVEVLARGAWDEGGANELLDPNPEILGALRIALATPTFQNREPRSPGFTVVDLSNIKIREVAFLAALRAVQRARRGDTEGALDDVRAALRLGRRLAEADGGGLIDGLVAAECQATALAGLDAALPSLALDAPGAKALAGELASLQIPGPAWQALWAGEYRQFDQGLASAPEPEPSAGSRAYAALVPPAYTLKRNATLTQAAQTVRALQLAAGGQCAALPSEGFEREPRSQLLLRALGPNGGGEIALYAARMQWHRLALRRCLLETRVAAAQALVALRAYELERGTLPATLAALVPRYLGAVPIDAFDGAPLRYAPQRKLLYSVGSDLHDEQGAQAARGRDSDLVEPAFEIRDASP